MPVSGARSVNWRLSPLVPQNSYFLQGVLGVHDGSVVWSGVRMRGYPPRCVTSKPVRLDEFCDACQGRVGPVLDCFQSCQSDEWWEDNEPSTRVSSRIEPAYLFKFTTTCGILDFPVFEKDSSSVRLPPPPHSFVSLFHS